jgi:hypothetical protein
MSIDATPDTAASDEVCELCGQAIRKGWRCIVTSTYTDTAADCELTDYCHTECLAMTENWTDDDWDSFSDGEPQNVIQWPTYDEHGNVVRSDS